MIPGAMRDASRLYLLGVSPSVEDVEERIPAVVLEDWLQLKSELRAPRG